MMSTILIILLKLVRLKSTMNFFLEVLKKYVTLKESLVQIQLFQDN